MPLERSTAVIVLALWLRPALALAPPSPLSNHFAYHLLTPPLTSLPPHLGRRRASSEWSLLAAAEEAHAATATSGPSAVRSVRRPSPPPAPFYQMVSFYRFFPVDDPTSVRDRLFAALLSCEDVGEDLRGTAYVASEGINAQFALPVGSAAGAEVEAAVGRLAEVVRSALPFDPFERTEINVGELVASDVPTFDRLLLRTRDAILRSGLEGGVGPGGRDRDRDWDWDWDDAGRECSPAEWDANLRRMQAGVEERGIVLDCRNSYESDVGSFQGAEPLGTDLFQESWPVLRERTEGMDRSEPVHIFCTGGIRCVKVGAFLRQELGFTDVRRLKNGIINYEKWAEAEGGGSMWEGENFLFDKRRLASQKAEEESASKS